MLFANIRKKLVHFFMLNFPIQKPEQHVVAQAFFYCIYEFWALTKQMFALY
jgi:hypothetical protein